MPILTDQQRRRIRGKARDRTQRQLRKPRQKAQRRISGIQAGTAGRVAGVRRSYARGVEQIGNTSLKGLRGRYRQEVQQEIAGSQKGLGKAAQSHVRQVQKRGRKRIIGINRDVKAARQETMAANLTALMDAARARVEAKTEAGADQRDENRLAAQQARFMLELGPSDPKSVSREAREAGHPVTDEEWLMFTQSLAGKEGVGLAAAKRIVDRLRRQYSAAGVAGRAAGAVSAGARMLGR